MTVTIVQDPSKTYRCVCRKCGCVFTYEISDLLRKYYTGSYEYVACPSCCEECVHPDQAERQR